MAVRSDRIDAVFLARRPVFSAFGPDESGHTKRVVEKTTLPVSWARYENQQCRTPRGVDENVAQTG